MTRRPHDPSSGAPEYRSVRPSNHSSKCSFRNQFLENLTNVPGRAVPTPTPPFLLVDDCNVEYRSWQNRATTCGRKIRFRWSWHRLKAETEGFPTAQRSSKTEISVVVKNGPQLSRYEAVFDETKTVWKLTTSSFQRLSSRRTRDHIEKVVVNLWSILDEAYTTLNKTTLYQENYGQFLSERP